MTCGRGCALPALRARWGCDATSRDANGRGAAFSLPCWHCRGDRETCRVCALPGDVEGKATGLVRFDRCPTALQEPWVGRMLDSVSRYRDGFLPAPGGVLDQAYAWTTALRVALTTLRECERVVAERAAPPGR
jgi:hypothetical protein